MACNALYNSLGKVNGKFKYGIYFINKFRILKKINQGTKKNGLNPISLQATL